MRRAFSLVELSIVLVILGLLTGGILAGQSLIHASELRATSTEQARYRSAVNAFRDKYFQLPGDFSAATSFWGDQATGTAACPGPTANGTPGTCDGDSNGNIGTGDPHSTESFRFWQHLALAGLIEGSYTGYVGPMPPFFIMGTNIPTSKADSGGGWGVQRPGAGMIYNYQGNLLLLAKGQLMQDAIFKPEDAWNIDSKLDDGRPEYGAVLGGTWGSNCLTPNATMLSAPNDRAYALTIATPNCMMWFKI